MSNQTGYMTDLYDLSEVVDKEIKPLVDQLLAKADDHGLPLLIGMCPANHEDRVKILTMASFHGIQRTPTPLVAAMLCQESVSLAAMVMAAVAEREELD